jgi:dTDP-4-amino-4,6-dideoxygalactose transaminase
MIPIIRPLLGEEEAEAIRQVVLSGWVTQGPKVAEFEKAFAEYTGADHACAVSSCTAALHLALRAAGVRPGDVVATVSHSFIATANAVRLCGAEPVFADILPESWCIDPADLQRLLDKDFEPRKDGYYYRELPRIAVGESPLVGMTAVGRLAAIVPVHQMGFPAELERVLEVGARYGVPVIEDAACAAGSAIITEDADWERVGRPRGQTACFSFHPRKLITTGDGGMITTADPELDARFRMLRHHGMDVSDEARHRADEVIVERYLETAYNYRMTDLQAAMGLVQLGKLEENIAERRRLAGQYNDLLAGIPGLEPPRPAVGTRPNWQSYPVLLLEDAPLNQAELMRRLLSQGIASRPGIMNAHQEAPYRAAGWSLPRSEAARERVLLLPLFSGMSQENVETVVLAIRHAFGLPGRA